MILLSEGQKVLSLCQAISQQYIRTGWHAVTTKCDFVLENVDWLAQLRRALRVENYFSWGNQLFLDGSQPAWRAVSMLIPRWGSLGSWSNVFSCGLPPACFLSSPFARMSAPSTPAPHLAWWHGPTVCTHLLDKSWGRGGGDSLAMFFWLTQRRERREWGKECVHLWLYTFTCVPEKSLPWKGDSWGVLCCLFSGKLCDIYWWPVTSLFQQKLCKENGSEGFGQNADRISCLSESTYGR